MGFSETSADAAKATAAKRTRQEVEVVLRKVICDLRAEMKNAKNADDVVIKTTAKWAALCRELSECETAKKGGNMCGELGWLTPEERGMYGPGFREVIDVLLPG